VRGTTSREIVQMARDAGARKVYFASASPPVRYPNVYGIDMPNQKELVASGRTEQEVAREIGADLLIYQDLEALKRAVRAANPRLTEFEASCFDGKYVTGDVTPEYLAQLAGERHEDRGQPGADDDRAGALVMATQGQAGLWERRQSMGDSDMHQRAGRSDRAGSPVFALLKSKLRCPLMRPGTVPRSLLIERLARADSRPVVSVVAPPGYGKTTLLSQWAEHNGQSFAWVSVDEGDNDPKVLLTYVAEALDAVAPIDERVFDALASPVSSLPGSVIPRLGSSFSSMTSPPAW